MENYSVYCPYCGKWEAMTDFIPHLSHRHDLDLTFPEISDRLRNIGGIAIMDTATEEIIPEKTAIEIMKVSN